VKAPDLLAAQSLLLQVALQALQALHRLDQHYALHLPCNPTQRTTTYNNLIIMIINMR
jgi:hypothetical protein